MASIFFVLFVDANSHLSVSACLNNRHPSSKRPHAYQTASAVEMTFSAVIPCHDGQFPCLNI